MEQTASKPVGQQRTFLNMSRFERKVLAAFTGLLTVTVLGFALPLAAGQIEVRRKEEVVNPGPEQDKVESPQQEKPKEEQGIVPVEPSGHEVAGVADCKVVAFDLKGVHAALHCVQEYNVRGRPRKLHSLGVVRPGERLIIAAFSDYFRVREIREGGSSSQGITRDSPDPTYRGSIRSSGWKFRSKAMSGQPGDVLTLCQFLTAEHLEGSGGEDRYYSGFSAANDFRPLIPLDEGLDFGTILVRHTFNLMIMDPSWKERNDRVQEFLEGGRFFNTSLERYYQNELNQVSETRLPWLLLSLPGERKERASKALQAATRLQGRFIGSDGLETVAAIHAELDNYEKAVATQELAVEKAMVFSSGGGKFLAQQRLQVYRDRRLEALVKGLESPTPEGRAESKVAIVRLGAEARAAIPALEKLLKADAEGVRQAATQTLEAIAPLEQLVKRMKDSELPAETRLKACGELADRFWYRRGAYAAFKEALEDTVLREEAERCLRKITERTVSLHGAGNVALAFSSDGTTLATLGHQRDDAKRVNSEVKLWDTGTSKLRRTLQCSGMVHAIIFRPDGKSLLTAEEKAVRTWDCASGKEIDCLEGPSWASLSPDGRTVCSVDGSLWDLTDRKRTFLEKGVSLSHIEGHSLAADRFASWTQTHSDPYRLLRVFSGDGRYLAVGFPGQTREPQVVLYDIAERKEVSSVHTSRTGFVSQLAFARSKPRLAYLNWRGNVHIFPIADNFQGSVPESLGRVTNLAWSPDGSMLALEIPRKESKTDKHSIIEVILWDLEKKRSVVTFDWFPSGLQRLVFSPDGTVLATTDDAGAVQLWRLGELLGR